MCRRAFVTPLNLPCAMATLDSTRLEVNGLDVTQLDDDELYTRLQDLGSPVGPIVATTRSVYEKKLYVLLGGHLPDSPTFNGDIEQEDEEEDYSDSEPEVAKESPKQTRNRVVTETSHKRVTTTSSAASPSTSQFMDIRRRVLVSGDDATDSSEVVYNPDVHTPSPRPSLRTVSSSTSETTSYRRVFNNTASNSRSAAVAGTDTVDSGPGKVSLCLRLLVKLLFLALLIAAALYFYQNSPSESPFKAIEELARQAIEAAAGEEAEGAPETVGQPAAVAPPPATN